MTNRAGLLSTRHGLHRLTGTQPGLKGHQVILVNSDIGPDTRMRAWLMRVRPAPGALAAAKLLSAAQYAKLLEADGG